MASAVRGYHRWMERRLAGLLVLAVAAVLLMVVSAVSGRDTPGRAVAAHRTRARSRVTVNCRIPASPAMHSTTGH